MAIAFSRERPHYTQPKVRPKIGVTCGATGPKPSYVAALEEAGAEVVELRPGAAVEIHGLLLTGGPDIEPCRYDQEKAQETGKPDRERDRFEVELARRVRADGLPVLGICRGLQITAVAFGGSLIQDVAGHRDPDLRHPMLIAEGSRLRELAGAAEVSVNSRHHQIVKLVPQDFRVTAISTEGYVEGMESADGHFICVQCHPEDLRDEPWASALFADLVAQATRRVSRGTKSVSDIPAAVEEAVHQADTPPLST